MRIRGLGSGSRDCPEVETAGNGSEVRLRGLGRGSSPYYSVVRVWRMWKPGVGDM